MGGKGMSEGQRKMARNKRRRAARERVDSRRYLPGCPAVGKPGYDLSDADEARLAERRGGPHLRLERCVCGYWHHVRTT